MLRILVLALTPVNRSTAKPYFRKNRRY